MCFSMSAFYSNMKLRISSKLRVPWISSVSSRKLPNKKGSQTPVNSRNNSATSGFFSAGSLQTLPQPQWTHFEGASDFVPDFHVVLFYLSDQDNVPARLKTDDEFVYYISQSRSPGHKDQGQDCMTTAAHGDWEIHTLCDGHDKLGHMVALGVCQTLPKVLLRMLNDESNKDFKGINEKIIKDSFEETSRVVCWTSEGITVGIWVKVFEGPWADKPGYIKESSTNGRVRVAIIDENGYHLPAIDRKLLRRPRYTGGCTCVTLIKNKVTKECRVAVSGDSRIVIVPGITKVGDNAAELKDDPILGVLKGKEPETQSALDLKVASSKPASVGVITPAHNVFNESERARLQKDFLGQYEFDGNFLVNPITKFAIQPTRGFGDFDMFGTGYTHLPEITQTFKLLPDSVLLCASDGVFDPHVWLDPEIVSCLSKYVSEGLSSVQIVDQIYRETLQRSLEGGYVDDISIFCYREPKADISDLESVRSKNDLDMEKVVEIEIPSPKSVRKKKDTKDKRRTIGRGPNSYSELSAQVLLKKQELDNEKHKVPKTQSQRSHKSEKTEKSGNMSKLDSEANLAELEEQEEELSDEDVEKLVDFEKTGELMKSIAASKGLKQFARLDPKDLATGKSFSAAENENDVANQLMKGQQIKKQE